VKEEIKNAEQALKRDIKHSQNKKLIQLYLKLLEEFNRASTNVENVYNRDKELQQIVSYIESN